MHLDAHSSLCLLVTLLLTSLAEATHPYYSRFGHWGRTSDSFHGRLHQKVHTRKAAMGHSFSGIEGRQQPAWSSDSSPSSSSPFGSTSSFDQNGGSSWGTFNQQPLPKYVGGSTNKSTPWGGITCYNSNPYSSAPQTSQIRKYRLTVSHCNVRPDGVVTSGAVCVNGQFPGPLIEANYGDMLQITVTNNLTDEGTSMHWHGFLQTNNNHNDGVPGVQQCPIAPGQSQTYTMRAELYGSTWYHTHYSAQYAGGAVGPIVIYGPYSSDYDLDLGPIMLMEWYRNDYKTSVQNIMRPLSQGGPIRPLANTNLINGKNRFDCSMTKLGCKTADYARFNFTSGKNHRLRIMNTGSGAVQKFTIDNGHQMQVIATDLMPVKPYNTTVLVLAVGQRADVIVYGSGKPGSRSWMRSNIVACSLNDGVQTEARAAIFYEDSDTTLFPAARRNEGPGTSTSPMSCANDPLSSTEPTYPIAVKSPAVTRTLSIVAKSNGTNILYYMGNNSFKADFNDPILPHALQGQTTNFSAARNTWDIGTAPSARVIIYNYDDAPHPIHLHGHNMQILNLGMGQWDGSIVRASNPQRRDVQLMPPALNPTTPSFLVIQWDAGNPGVWPLHCHFAWHSSMGLVANVIEGGDTIASTLRGAAMSLTPVCNAWNAWTKKIGTLETDIDSGL